MPTPSNNFMKLVGGTDNGNSTIYTADDSTVQNLIKVGDTIKVSGTTDNNGVYTVTEINTDGTALGSTGDVYYSLKGQILTDEDSAGTTKPIIEVIRAPGDKLCALGDVGESGDNAIDVWSNNATTDYVGVSPASADGWIKNAINPTATGDNAQYIYHFVDESLRVCNINEENTSFIKWFGYIQRTQFASTYGLSFAGWQENPNTLAPPKLATSFTYAYINSPNVNGGSNTTLNADEHDPAQATNFYSENRGVARGKKDSTSLLRFRADTGELSNMLPSAKKTFFAGALNDNDSLFDFEDNNGDGSATLVDSDGFVAFDSATFEMSSNTGVLTNGSANQGSVSLRLTTVVGATYQVSFDVLAAGNSNISISLGSDSTNFNTDNQSGAIAHAGDTTGNTLIVPYTATSTTSYLIIKLSSSTSGHHGDIDNLTVRRVDQLSFENTSAVERLDQASNGEIITIGEALGTFPKEVLFCTKRSGGQGGTITYQRRYGGILDGSGVHTSGSASDPHACIQGDSPILERGLGFNVGITDGTADGDWEAGTYEFYQSFVYENNQESLPFQMGDGDDGSNLAAGTHTSAGGKALRISVYADLAYNARLVGARVYTRLANTDNDLTLLVDIDIVKGIKMTFDGDHVGWSYQSGKGYYVTGPATGNATTPNIDTYDTINGYSPDVHFNAFGGRNEIYKASVIANRRTFIANVKLKGKNIELQKHGDRLMYSEINKFDTFLEHNFIDVSKGDYGEYTALESYADRLLAFKNNLVHVINIASPSPAGWYLEDTIKYAGVNFSFSVTKTKYGIAWVSDDGCYIYDGNRATNLIEKKIATSSASYTSTNVDWQSWYRGSGNVKDVMIGYDAISNSLIMLRSPNDSTTNSNQGWVYDFDSNGWIFHSNIFDDSETYTNFVTDWNNNLVLGLQNSNDVDFKKFLPVSKSSSGQEFVTKDIDFGEPGLIKKVYAVYVTYKSDGAETTPFKYAIDGKQSFSGGGGGTFTGNLVDTSGQWDIVKLVPATNPLSCQSIQIKFDVGSAGIFEFNDLSIEYRVIRNKRVS